MNRMTTKRTFSLKSSFCRITEVWIARWARLACLVALAARRTSMVRCQIDKSMSDATSRHGWSKPNADYTIVTIDTWYRMVQIRIRSTRLLVSPRTWPLWHHSAGRAGTPGPQRGAWSPSPSLRGRVHPTRRRPRQTTCSAVYSASAAAARESVP